MANPQSCIAPLIENLWDKKAKKKTPRCGLPLGEETALYAYEGYSGPAGRKCEKGHFSLKCPKCGVIDFAITSYPKGYHETFMGVYWCRNDACGAQIYSDEGIDINLGEVIG